MCADVKWVCARVTRRELLWWWWSQGLRDSAFEEECCQGFVGG